MAGGGEVENSTAPLGERADVSETPPARSPRTASASPPGGVPLPDLLRLDAGADGTLRSVDHDINFNGAIFGGQIFAQSLAAAQLRGPQGWTVTAATLVFGRGGSATPAMQYRTETLTGGRSFATLAVHAEQAETRIATALVTLGRSAAPVVAEALPHTTSSGPTGLQSGSGQISQFGIGIAPSCARLLDHPRIDIRLVDPEAYAAPIAGQVRFWIRARDPIPDDPAFQLRAFTYLTDFWVPLVPVLRTRAAAQIDEYLIASINHSLWVYAEPRADEWCSVETEIQGRGGERAVTVARFRQPGRGLVAVLAVEAVYRARRPREAD